MPAVSLQVAASALGSAELLWKQPPYRFPCLQRVAEDRPVRDFVTFQLLIPCQRWFVAFAATAIATTEQPASCLVDVAVKYEHLIGN